MLQAGRLKHRVVIQYPNGTQNLDTGGYSDDWSTLTTVWAAIEPISAREFVASSTENSKVNTRIIVRYRKDIKANMRLWHAAKDKYYNIEGVLSDKDSGLEYLTLVCSEGMRYEQDPAALIPVNLGVVPVINGNMNVGATVTATTGRWANKPTSFKYKWFNNGVEIANQTTDSLIVPNNIGNSLTVKVTAVNSAGNSSPAQSAARTIIA